MVILTFNIVFLVVLSFERDIDRLLSSTKAESDRGFIFPDILLSQRYGFFTFAKSSLEKSFLTNNHVEPIVFSSRFSHLKEGHLDTFDSSDWIEIQRFDLNLFRLGHPQTIHLLRPTKKE